MASSTGDVVLVTGGAGFIGGHVIESLLSRGDRVVSVDEVNDYYDVSIKEENLRLLRTKWPEDKYTFCKGDIADHAFMKAVFDTHKPNVVCHLAARAGVRASIDDPMVYGHSNLMGTIVILELSRLAKVRNIVLASSSSVYGARSVAPFKETDEAVHPVSPYAATKRSCELLAWTHHDLYKIPTACLRFFTVYGPRGRPDMAPFLFVDKIYRGETIKQFGDGSSMRDYTFVADIVQGVIGAIDSWKEYPGFEIYNLGRGDTISLTDFIELIEDLVGRKAKREFLPMQAGDVPLTQADISHARKQLKYNPQTPVRDGMRVFVEWYIQHYHTDKST